MAELLQVVQKILKIYLTFLHKEVRISNVAGSYAKDIRYVRVAQLDRATGYGPVGRGFKSFHARYCVCLCTLLLVLSKSSKGVCPWSFLCVLYK